MARSRSRFCNRTLPRWIEREREACGSSSTASAEIGDGAVAVAFDPVGNAAIVEGQCVLGIELDRLVEVGDGAVGVAFGAVAERAVVIGWP